MNTDNDIRYDFWDPSHDLNYTWDEKGFWRRKTLRELIDDGNRATAAAYRSEEQKVIEKRKARGAVAYWVQTVADVVDKIFLFVCMIAWPLLIIYFPLKLLIMGVWELIYWSYSNTPRWLTRAVRAARTKARDFEKATRPE